MKKKQITLQKQKENRGTEKRKNGEKEKKQEREKQVTDERQERGYKDIRLFTTRRFTMRKDKEKKKKKSSVKKNVNEEYSQNFVCRSGNKRTQLTHRLKEKLIISWEKNKLSFP